MRDILNDLLEATKDIEPTTQTGAKTMTDKDKAELSEIVDGTICCADVTDWDSQDEFEEEIMSDIEQTRTLSSDEYTFCAELVATYWHEHGGDDDRDEEDDE